MDGSEVVEKVERAVKVLLMRERRLLILDINERTLTHKLAIYLSREFQGAGLNVDCEYNRMGTLPKQLHLDPRPVESDDQHATTVYPDIIVHRRETDAENLLVLEAKKTTCPRTHELDYTKLRAFEHELHYRFTVFLLLRTGDPEHVGATLDFGREGVRAIGNAPALRRVREDVF